MIRPLTLFALALGLAARLGGTEIVSNTIPGGAKFLNYGTVDWKGRMVDAGNVNEFGDAVSHAALESKSAATKAGANLVVLVSPESGTIVPQTVLPGEVRLREHDPVLVALFLKVPDRWTPRSDGARIRYATRMQEISGYQSIDYKIEKVADSAGVSLAFWVYLNLPRFVAEAVANRYDTITIRSSKDADCEEVWLPGCDLPLRISRKNPVIDCTIYKRKAT
ncbi:MAG TPA: hypothetical protein VHE13_04215 [Opitutus sp.]|nr:hypothetical protein [Opitutus sp.]